MRKELIIAALATAFLLFFYSTGKQKKDAF